LRNEPAVRQHEHGIGKPGGEAEIVRHHHDQHAAVRSAAQVDHDVNLVAWIERGGRFVREHDRCFDGQHPRQRDPAALAAGQFRDGAFSELNNVGNLHRAQHSLFVARRQPCRIGGPMRITPKRDHVFGRQRPVHQMALRQVSKTLRALA
jgi:hypothetical protein